MNIDIINETVILIFIEEEAEKTESDKKKNNMDVVAARLAEVVDTKVKLNGKRLPDTKCTYCVT